MSASISNKLSQRAVFVFPAELSGTFIFEFMDYERASCRVALVEGTWEEMGAVVSEFISTGVFNYGSLIHG